MLKSILIKICGLALFLTQAHAEERLEVARAYLDEHRLSGKEAGPLEADDPLRIRILDSRDPGTKFGPFAFALARHGEKYLSAPQAREAKALIEARAGDPVNWHDVRNIVRMQASYALWEYAAEADPVKAGELEAEWEAWTDLRLDYMFQEFVAQVRFQRAMWALYTPEQRSKITSGEWDHLIKKNVGHGRLFSADKQVVRAMGAPGDKAAFDAAAGKWRKRWETILSNYEAAARFQRQCEFAMDETTEAFDLSGWQEYEEVFRDWAVAECEAIREILQAGYEKDETFRKKLEAQQKELQAQTVENYQAHAAEFLRLLGEI